MCSFEQINFKSKISLLDTGDQSTQSHKYHPSRSFSWDVTKKHWNFHVNNISNFFHVSCLIGSALVLHLVFWSPRSKDKTQESKAFHNLNWCNFSIRKSKQREVWIIFTYTISKSLCYLENWDIFILRLKSVVITLMQTETILSIMMLLQVLSTSISALSVAAECWLVSSHVVVWVVTGVSRPPVLPGTSQPRTHCGHTQSLTHIHTTLGACTQSYRTLYKTIQNIITD